MLSKLKDNGEFGFMFPHCFRSTFRIFNPKMKLKMKMKMKINMKIKKRII